MRFTLHTSNRLSCLDMIAALGETTAGPALPRLRDAMLKSPEGRRILKDRPTVNSETVDMDKLRALPDGTFGRAYITWLEKCGVTPDTREPVSSYFPQFFNVPELSYVGSPRCIISTTRS